MENGLTQISSPIPLRQNNGSLLLKNPRSFIATIPVFTAGIGRMKTEKGRQHLEILTGHVEREA